MFQHINIFKPGETGYRIEVSHDDSTFCLMNKDEVIVYFKQKQEAENYILGSHVCRGLKHQFPDKEFKVVEHVF